MGHVLARGVAMNFGEIVDGHRRIAVTVIVAAMLAIAAWAWRASAVSSGQSTKSRKAFYTVDDGQTVFVESGQLIPPFDWQGKTAYRAAVFSCDGGKTRFVGYLERYTPAAKKRLELANPPASSSSSAIPTPGVVTAETEIKKPGPGNPWVSRANFAKAAKVAQVTVPPGGVGEPEIVVP